MELIQPLFDLLTCIWQPINKRIGYGRRLTENFTDLSTRVTKLCHRGDDINNEIEQVKLQKTPTRECTDWLADVEEVEKKVKILEQEFNDQKGCFKGWFSYSERINLGKLVIEMIDHVKDLQEKSKFEGGFVTNLPPARVEMVPAPTVEAESASDRMLRKIMNGLSDNRTHKIGIWGMGGVGKTTMLKLVNNMPEITSMFDIVIWVTVSKSWSIRKIQDEIAQRLSLHITHDSNDRASRIILSKLEGNKFLLLLDDLWEMVDLRSVGLPNTTQENGCKVVLTTRELGICRKMETDVEIKVEVLSEEESWKLFSSKVGKLENLPAIEPLAKLIVRKCGGLPLALSVLGGALRKVEDTNVWRNYLRELNSPATFYVKDMNEHVFKPLKVSYDQLSDTDHKNCFLYCGLYPEGHNIEASELIDYWTVEKFLSGRRTLAEARDKGRAILQVLVDASFLESCKRDVVKMHDVVRDLVMHMTSSDGDEGKFVVRSGLSNEKIPEIEWENAKKVSLMNSKSGFLSLPEMPNCPMLTTLLLQNNDMLSALPESFFTNMPILRVLDLSWTPIKYLPSSVSNLVNLGALFLKDCHSLKELPREISSLQVLEMVRTTHNMIPYIPDVFWELTNLKCIEFSSLYGGDRVEEMTSSMTVRSGMISRLHQLEELSLVEVKSELLTDERLEVLARELGGLRELSSLEFDFREVNNLECFLKNSRPWRDQSLTTFCFFVGIKDGGEKLLFVNFKRFKRSLMYGGGRVENSHESSIVPSAIIDVLARSEIFALERQGELRKLSDLGLKNMQELKQCIISYCGALETIADGDYNIDAFPNLEDLQLRVLANLRSFWDGPLVQSGNKSFTKLSHLGLYKCNSLKKLFSVSLIQQLDNLKTLSITQCPKFKEIIYVDVYDTHDQSGTILPNLETLSLNYLPEFKRFSEVICSLWWPSLKKLDVHDCPKLKKLGFRDGDAANLKTIWGGREWWEALEWEDESIKVRFDPLLSAGLGDATRPKMES